MSTEPAPLPAIPVSRYRRWLGLGPSTADLHDRIEWLSTRLLRSNAEAQEAHARIKAERARRHEAGSRLTQLEHRFRKLVVGATEPARTGCDKIRFHRRAEACEFVTVVAASAGQNPDAFDVYPCRACPRSPLTNRAYLHIGHPKTSLAQQEKAASIARSAARSAAAHRGGHTIGQMISPADLARLRNLKKETS